ncbi:MAG: hypothetical protein RL088_501 [Verrucomicrobiota bacterium]
MTEHHRDGYDRLQAGAGPVARKVLSAVAMIACVPFGLSLAATLIDGTGALDEAEEALEKLTEGGLVFEIESVGGERMWRFTSPALHAAARTESQTGAIEALRMMTGVRVALKTRFTMGPAASKDEINNLLEHAAELLRNGPAESKWTPLAEWLLDRAAGQISHIGFHDSALKCLGIVDEWFSRLAPEVSSNPVWKAECFSLLSRRADLLTSSGDLREAIKNATEAAEIAHQLASNDKCPGALQRRKDIVEKLAELHTAEGNLSEAQAGYGVLSSLDALIATASAAASPAESARIIQGSLSRGSEKFRRSQFSSALADYAEARRLAELGCLSDEAGIEENEMWFSSLLKLGQAHAALHQHHAARECFREAGRIAEEFSKTSAGNSPWNARLRNAVTLLGDAFFEEGNASDAIPMYSKCLALEENASIQNPDSGRFEISALLLKLAAAYARNDHLEKARECVERACSIRTSLLAESPHDLERVRALLVAFTHAGSILVTANDVEQATAQFEAALNIAEDLCAEEPEHAIHQADRAVLREQLSLLRAS